MPSVGRLIYQPGYGIDLTTLRSVRTYTATGSPAGLDRVGRPEATL